MRITNDGVFVDLDGKIKFSMQCVLTEQTDMQYTVQSTRSNTTLARDITKSAIILLGKDTYISYIMQMQTTRH